MSADSVILKILTGMQAGVEVALAEGTYAVGSGTDDDIQLVDVSLLASHFRLRVAAGKAEVAAQAGPVQLGAGATLTPDQGWHGLEPLEAATAGTTRFALGPRSANWASVAEDGQRGASVALAAAEPGLAPSPAPIGRLRPLAVPLLGLVVVALLGGWYALTGGHLTSVRANHADELRTVRAALDAFPFGGPIETRQEVDGAIYVSGYVETPVERRALAGAVDRTGTPVRLRLFVLDDIRREVTSLIAAEKLPVTSSVSDKGAVTLDGLVLQPARAQKLVDEIRETVLGVSGVTSRIRTADTLIEAVRQLVSASQLKPWLLLRLDGDVIEVSGALPSDKVDAWVGFLQDYASRFADEVALRSFVQLQAPNGRLTPAPGVAGALAVGPRPAVPGDTAVDVERLRRGDFSLGDIFVGEHGTASRRDRAASESAVPAAHMVADAGRRDRAPAPATTGTAAALAGSVPAPNAPATGRPDVPVRAAAGVASAAPGRGAPSPDAPGSDGGAAARGMERATGAASVAAGRGGPSSGAPAMVGAGRVTEPGAPAIASAAAPPARGGASSEASAPGRPEASFGRAAGSASPAPGPGSAAAGRADAPLRPDAAVTPARDMPALAASRPARTDFPIGVVTEFASAVPGARPAASPPAEAVVAASPAGGTPSGDAVARDDRDAAAKSAPAASGPGDGDAAARRPRADAAPDPAPAETLRVAASGTAAPAADGPVAADAIAPGVVVRTAPEQLAAGPLGGERRVVDDLADRAAQALKRFRDGEAGQDDADRAIDQAVALLESRGNGAISPGAGRPPAADWYLPLFVDPRAPRPGAAPCWAGTSLTADDLLPVLFWLDVMSASRRVTLAAFDQAQQSLLIEAALDPREVAACGRRSPTAGAAADHSLYLREVSRNPGFVAFVLRDLPAAELDIAGASLGRRRFVITGTGDRMAEGAAPDRSSRLAVVGELGLALQREDGLSVMVFGPGISWTVTE